MPSIQDEAGNSVAIEAVPRGEIEFRNLTFRYATGARVLHQVNLTIPAGSSLAIVGPTGSGKSTLVNLIPRLLDAAPGEVLIDGLPIREWPLATLRRSIGFVPQETFLFSSSIRENIAFGVESATDEQIERAALGGPTSQQKSWSFRRDSTPWSVSVASPCRAAKKQRTSIARALLRDPRILILDDALASVDTYTEEQILAGLREVMQDRTTILIAHRVSTARSADRIAVLINGDIREIGTHEELVRTGGYYADLFEKQQLEEEIVSN